MAEIEILYKLTISIEPKTKKNSSNISTKCKKPKLLPSKEFIQYQEDCRWFIEIPKEPIKCKCNIKAVYYRRTRRRVDITNLHSALHDILVYYGVIADDSCKFVIGTDGSRVKVDRHNPRTEIVITKCDEVTGFES